MKILLISPLAPPNGGIATWTEKYIDFFNARKNYEIDLINSGKGSCTNNLKNEFSRFFRILNEVRIFNKNKYYDIVHYNTSCSKMGIIRDYVIVKLLSKKRNKIILQCHCNVEDQMGQGKIQIKLLKKMCEKCKVVLVLNDFSKKYLQNLGITSFYFPNFIDEEFILKTNKEIKKDLNRIIYIGHVAKIKGVEILFSLAESRPDLIFEIVGKIDDEYKDIVKQLPKNIMLLGDVDRNMVKNYLDKADVFLLPSISEGFSMSLLEAMARGLPIIATNVGDNSNMLEENKGGVIIKERNVEEFRNAIKYLEQKDRREVCSKFNIIKSKQYSREIVLRNLIKIYEEISISK